MMEARHCSTSGNEQNNILYYISRQTRDARGLPAADDGGGVSAGSSAHCDSLYPS